MLKYVSYQEFTQEMVNLLATGPEVEFEDDYTTEDWWDEGRQKVVGYIRYWNHGEVQYIITGY